MKFLFDISFLDNAMMVKSKGRSDYRMPSKWSFSQPRERDFTVTNGLMAR